MKIKKLIVAGVAATGLLLAGCAPLVTSGPDVVVGGGIYPPPLLDPPMNNPGMYRPGAPNGPGFLHGGVATNPATPGKPSGQPQYPGNSGGNGQRPNNGNQRVPGQR